jgi:cobalamin synthase
VIGVRRTPPGLITANVGLAAITAIHQPRRRTALITACTSRASSREPGKLASIVSRSDTARASVGALPQMIAVAWGVAASSSCSCRRRACSSYRYGQVVYGQLAAYSILYSLPAVLLYLVLSRRLGGAFTFGGAMKG